MLDGALLEVVQHLIARRMPGAGEGGDFVEVGDIEIAHAPGEDLAVANQNVEGCDRFLQSIGAAPMQEVAVKPVGSQTRQGSLARLECAALRCVARQYFGDQEDFVAPALECLGNEGFRGPRSVHFGGVDVRQAEVESAAKRGDGGVGRRLFERPRALTDRRHGASSIAEYSHGGVATHRYSITPSPRRSQPPRDYVAGEVFRRWILRRRLGYTYEQWQSLGVGFRQGGLEHDDAGCAGRNPQARGRLGFYAPEFCAPGRRDRRLRGALLPADDPRLGAARELATADHHLAGRRPAVHGAMVLAEAQLDLDPGRSSGGGTHGRRSQVRSFHLAPVRAVHSRQFARRHRRRVHCQAADGDAVPAQGSLRAAVHRGGRARLRGERRARRREFDGSAGRRPLSA